MRKICVANFSTQNSTGILIVPPNRGVCEQVRIYHQNGVYANFMFVYTLVI